MTKVRMFFSLFIFVTFSIFSQNIEKPNDTLPVELVYFVGDVADTTIEIRWGTATEVNNYGYDILRADTSFNWITIDFVQGHGNSYSPKDYLFVDTTISENGKYYYLLKQIDFDGNFEMTDDTVIVTVDYATSVFDRLGQNFSSIPEVFKLYQNYPNPFNPETIIRFEVSNPNFISLDIFSTNGEFIENIKKGEESKGTYSVKFKPNYLSSGTYIYKLTVGNKSFTKKMLYIK